MSAATKCFLAKKGEVEPDWFVVDADAQIVGRFATRIAMVLIGKHKPTYTPHVDCGDCVIVLNVDNVRFTGRQLAHPTHPNYTVKMQKKIYDRYTGYPGGFFKTSMKEMIAKKGVEFVVRKTVDGMIPRNKLRAPRMKNLEIHA